MSKRACLYGLQFFYKKSANSGVATFTNKSARHKLLAEDIHKPIITKFETKKFILDLKIMFWVLIWHTCN